VYYVTKNIFLSSSNFPGSLYLLGADNDIESPTSQNPVPGTTTWTVAKLVSGSYMSMTASTAATVGVEDPRPHADLSTVVGEGWCSGPYTGIFARSTMSISMSLDSTQVSAQAGKFTFRLWKASDVLASNASLITPNIIYSTTGTITTATNVILTGLYEMTSSVVMRNEYLFVEMAWGITVASGHPNANVRVRHGSASVLRTGPFEDNSVFITGDNIS
jgi:hypothetical protein